LVPLAFFDYFLRSRGAFVRGISLPFRVLASFSFPHLLSFLLRDFSLLSNSSKSPRFENALRSLIYRTLFLFTLLCFLLRCGRCPSPPCPPYVTASLEEFSSPPRPYQFSRFRMSTGVLFSLPPASVFPFRNLASRGSRPTKESGFGDSRHKADRVPLGLSTPGGLFQPPFLKRFIPKNVCPCTP